MSSRLRLSRFVFAAGLLAGSAGFARADAPDVSDLAVSHHDGQTFVVWNAPAGTGWTYRIHASDLPITDADAARNAELLGEVGDSTACDVRLSRLTGTLRTFRVDSLGPSLGSSQGVFVATPVAPGRRYYAVTTRRPGPPAAENLSIVPGVNATLQPLAEAAGQPRPVWQCVLHWDGADVDIYTLWASDVSTALWPAMANRPSEPFDCLLRRGAPGGALMVRAHSRGGSFLQLANTATRAEEWTLGLDDALPNGQNTYYFGYHERYDIRSHANPVPSDGSVMPYTFRRVVATIEWAQRTFPTDATRCYAWGYSMGGIAGTLLATLRPDLVAAVMSFVGKFDFSVVDDSQPSCQFNYGMPLRQDLETFWGRVTDNLPCEGDPDERVFDETSAAMAAKRHAHDGLAPIIAISGRRDCTVGWGEKIAFYAAMNHWRQGGAWFWDPRDHAGTSGAYFRPLQDPRELYRFRLGRSFPALSNGSANSNPGNGSPASGDSLGQINGFVVWDTTVTDSQDEWSVTLRPRDLPTELGTIRAPETLRTDVTPRRLQSFGVSCGAVYHFLATRITDGAALAEGDAVGDGLGLLTIPGVPVDRSGTRLSILAPVLSGSASTSAPPDRLRLAVPSPIVGDSVRVVVQWPRAGEGRLEVFDSAGRRRLLLAFGPVAPGRAAYEMHAGALGSGVYFLRAGVGDLRESLRVSVLH